MVIGALIAITVTHVRARRREGLALTDEVPRDDATPALASARVEDRARISGEDQGGGPGRR